MILASVHGQPALCRLPVFAGREGKPEARKFFDKTVQIALPNMREICYNISKRLIAGIWAVK